MPLVDVTLPAPGADALPEDVRTLLDEAGRRIDAWPAKTFVPSDFERVYRALRTVAAAGLAAGAAFCEWGSGFGVVAVLAARLGFEACGIEIDPGLVASSRSLAADFGVDAEFVQGSFVPPGGEDLTDTVHDAAWLAAGGACGHELLDRDPADFDLVFAYPWPGEEEVVENLFERYASTGALLLTFHGYEDLRLRRKVPVRPS